MRNTQTKYSTDTDEYVATTPIFYKNVEQKNSSVNILPYSKGDLLDHHYSNIDQ